MADETTTIVIMGATGDLTRRKLVPALFNLGRKGRLPEGMRIVSFARSDYSDDQFRRLMGESVQEFGESAVSGRTWEKGKTNRSLSYPSSKISIVDTPSG